MRLWDRIRGRRDPARRAALERAAAAVDREIAANLELVSLYGQTHQAVVLENGEFLRHARTLAAEVPAAHAALADLYGRMPEAESAMERRGPAASVRPEDRAIVERWEGDARDAQRSLRSAASAPAPALWSRVLGRLRARG